MYIDMHLTGNTYQRKSMDLDHYFVERENGEEYATFKVREVVVEDRPYGEFRQPGAQITFYATEAQLRDMRDYLTRALEEKHAERAERDAGETESVSEGSVETQEVQA